MSEVLEKVSLEIDRLRDEMVNTLIELIKIPAISPDYGGEESTTRPRSSSR